jgi:hypothetical protein
VKALKQGTWRESPDRDATWEDFIGKGEILEGGADGLKVGQAVRTATDGKAG